MSDLRLSCRHRNARGVAVERTLQRTRLDAIVQNRRRAVQVNVVDVLRFATGIFERESHRARGFVAIFGQTDAMIRVASSTVTEYLRINVRAAIPRVFELFQN